MPLVGVVLVQWYVLYLCFKWSVLYSYRKKV